MSQLVLTDSKGSRFKLNVVQFRSLMSASIESGQTRQSLHHYPIRAGQPDIQFTVQFRSIEDRREFQNFVRNHHINAQDDANYEINLWWPERDINNWTGYITGMRVREARFEYVPRVQFGVSLIHSLMSERTKLYSRGVNWGIEALGDLMKTITGEVDELLRPPTPPSSQLPPQSYEINAPNPVNVFEG